MRSLNLTLTVVAVVAMTTNASFFDKIHDSIDRAEDKYNKAKQLYPKTYVANGICDIYSTKCIIKGTLYGNKSYPLIVKDFNSDIDSLRDFKFVEFYLKKNLS